MVDIVSATLKPKQVQTRTPMGWLSDLHSPIGEKGTENPVEHDFVHQRVVS